MSKETSIAAFNDSSENSSNTGKLTLEPKTMASGEFSRDQLNEFISVLMKRKIVIHTPAHTYVEKMMELGHSAIISIADGDGKTTICRAIDNYLYEESEDDKPPDWLFLNACDPDKLVKDIWGYEDEPVPMIAEFRHYGANGVFSRERAGLTCFYFDRECQFIGESDSMFSISVLIRQEDIRGGLQRVEGRCKLIRQKMHTNLT